MEIKDIEHIAALAQLELTDEEKAKFSASLGDILKCAERMNEVDTANVAPLANVLDIPIAMREDEVIYENTREELMQNAPEREGDFFKVPKIGAN
jgi:aspartyl-tRNA(Asn)/glutamyl-tRNA(Gln) amidotransferase subunit C